MGGAVEEVTELVEGVTLLENVYHRAGFKSLQSHPSFLLAPSVSCIEMKYTVFSVPVVMPHLCCSDGLYLPWDLKAN